jgi:nucleoside-diphosphate-sugar epimerase
MLRSLHNIRWAEALPRMAADLLIIHVSIIGAFAVSVVYQSSVGNSAEAQHVISGFFKYYTGLFCILSPIFPLIFLLNGFYTHSRAYVGRYKTWVVVRGAAVAAAVFFAANFLLTGNQIAGRSVAVPFTLLAATGTAFMRVLKHQLDKRYVVQSNAKPSRAPHPAKILVVGGAGYIGSMLVERLLEKGYRVRVLDSLMYGDDALRPAKYHPDFELFVGDCRNIQDVVRAVRGVDSVVHLAAIVGDPACNQERESALETNYAATRMLIEIAKGQDVRRFLFASSCSVYGAADVEMDEKSAVQPISLYGHTKVDSENALLAARSDSFHPTILRYATVFGLGHRPRFDLVVNLLTAKAHQDGVITIYNGQQWRPFIHVRDLVDATIRVLEAPLQLVSGEIFNVGDTRLNHTLSDVAAVICELAPNVRIEDVENSDRRNYRVNFSKIQNRIGFRAQLSLNDGVREIRAAFANGLISDYRDIRYHNQRYLEVAPTTSRKNHIDSLVMAAFANHSDNGQTSIAMAGS